MRREAPVEYFVQAAERADFATMAAWIAPDSKVLDLGCGDGSLLKYLKQTRNVHGYGVDIDDANILESIKNGVNVIQTDLEAGLSGFESRSFDYVILSQTLQAVKNTERILMEMLRVARQCIVTFPNFGYLSHRLQVIRGRMPVSKALPYQWYDTPNLHLCTLKDFEAFCEARKLHVHERVVMTNGKVVSFLPNLRGSLAVYRFEQLDLPAETRTPTA